MATPAPTPLPAGRANERFDVTRWSVVIAARGDDAAGRVALECLCRTYWYPVYTFVRRQRFAPHDAEDLTQAFFARLLEKGSLDDVAREKGKFRSFLLASMKHFLCNERDRAHAQKRGGGRMVVSLDIRAAESRYAMEPSDGMTPEKIFDRRWALTLLEQVLARLRNEYSGSGRLELFEQLKPALTGQQPPYAQVGASLLMTEGAVKVAAHRLRQRYRQLIREEVAQTVGGDADVEGELRDLMSALSG